MSAYLVKIEEWAESQDRALDRFPKAEKERLRLAGQWPPPFLLFPPVESQGQIDRFDQAFEAQESRPDGRPSHACIDEQIEAAIRVLRSSPIALVSNQSCYGPPIPQPRDKENEASECSGGDESQNH